MCKSITQAILVVMVFLIHYLIEWKKYTVHFGIPHSKLERLMKIHFTNNHRNFLFRIYSILRLFCYDINHALIFFGFMDIGLNDITLFEEIQTANVSN